MSLTSWRKPDGAPRLCSDYHFDQSSASRIGDSSRRAGRIDLDAKSGAFAGLMRPRPLPQL